jgi:hypothetical protein
MPEAETKALLSCSADRRPQPPTQVLRTSSEKHDHIELAVRICADGPTSEAAASRENLAIVYEMRGNLLAAKRMRMSTGQFTCGNSDVCTVSDSLRLATSQEILPEVGLRPRALSSSIPVNSEYSEFFACIRLRHFLSYILFQNTC